MEKSSYSLSRRLLAMLLCIAMLVPAAMVPASATEVTEPTATVSTETVQTEETGSEESEPEWILPDCDCGSTETELGEHGETCARKVFLETFCEETAAAIYAKWEQLPEECRNYVLEYLGKDEANAEKLAELKGYIDAAAQTASEDAEETTGETEGTEETEGTTKETEGTTDETEGTTQETEGSTDETEGTTQATEGAVEETEAPTEPTMLLSAESDGTITVIAGSDFQNTSSDHSAGANVITEFMNGFVNAGYSALDGFLFCGDYIYNLNMTEAGSTAGKEALELAVWNAYGNRGLSKDAMVWVQGNHDPDSLVGDVLTKSGANDAAGYGVYVINEKDYMWYTNDEATVKNTAAALETYLDATAEFEVTNLPAGEKAVLLEKNRHAATGEDYQDIQIKNVVFFPEAMSLQEERLQITGGNGTLKVENISGEDIPGDIYIYYKHSASDLLYGGITYRVAVRGGLKAGESCTVIAGHYTPDTCRLLLADCGD